MKFDIQFYTHVWNTPQFTMENYFFIIVYSNTVLKNNVINLVENLQVKQ